MVAVQVALTLTALTGVVAIAVDGGILLAERRHAQATADAAAMAAASDLMLNWNNYAGVDTPGTASASAKDTASANGYKNDGTAGNGSGNSPGSSVVTVRLNGSNYLGGPSAGTAIPKGYAEVTVTYYQGRYFSTVLGSGTIAISARAVSRGKMAAIKNLAVLVLDPSGESVIDNGGGNSGGITVTGGSVVVNSSASKAIDTNGGATLTAQQFVVTGGYGKSNLVTAPTPNQVTTGVIPTADPYAYLPAPTQPAKADWYTQNGNIYVPPGAYGVAAGDTYNDLGNIPNGSNVYFIQASAGQGNVIYIGSGVTNGGFNSNNATYQMDPNTSGGVMIYNASSNGLDLGGNKSTSFSLTAPTSGIYQGIAYFQARNSTGDLTLNGNGATSITGTVYAPNASVTLNGNGTTVANQLIIKDMTLNGNGNVNVSYTQGSTGQGRYLQLVE
jgi:hypothetical protein